MTDQGDVPVAGFPWRSHTAGAPYSLRTTGANHRFELRRGERCASIGDDGTRERAELCCTARLPFGRRVTAEFDLLLEPGPVTDRRWLIPFQIHGDDAVTGASPVLALNIMPSPDRSGEVLRVDADTWVGERHSWRNFGAVAAFRRGVMHHLRIGFVDSAGHAGGAIRVELDGAVVLDMPSVVTGFDRARAGSYVKFGCYAGIATQASDTGLVSHIQDLALDIAGGPVS